MRKTTAILLFVALLLTIGGGIWFFTSKTKERPEEAKPRFTEQGKITSDSLNLKAPDVPEEEKPAARTPSHDLEKSNLKMVIIIDDIGQSLDRAKKILAINPEITLSILPFLPASKKIASELSSRNKAFLIHLPMEPQNYPMDDPGDGKVLTTMTNEEIREQTMKDIDAVPGAIGLNNHMGSRFSENKEKMNIIIDVLKEKGLIFIDSKTSPRSQGEAVAKEKGVFSLSRDVFLDNVLKEDEFAAQFEKAISIAKNKGVAIIIAHPHKETVAFLEKNIASLQENGIGIVNIGELPR